MNTIFNAAVILLLVLIIFGLVAIHIYQKRSRAIMRDLHEQQASHIWATTALHRSVIGNGFPLPPSGGWALSSDLLAYISAKIFHEKPKLVLELGSGLSTIVLGNALKKTGGRLISVEADVKYLDQTKQLVSNAGLSNCVTLIHAPLDNFNDTCIWYRKDSLNQLSGIDMLLVDGPPATTCAHARYPALPFFSDKLNHGALVILDDANRPSELEVIERWKREYPNTEVEFLPLTRSPALIRPSI